MAHRNTWFSQLETSIYNGLSIAMLNNQIVYTYIYMVYIYGIYIWYIYIWYIYIYMVYIYGIYMVYIYIYGVYIYSILFGLSIYWKCHHPNWRTLFFRGVGLPPPPTRYYMYKKSVWPVFNVWSLCNVDGQEIEQLNKRTWCWIWLCD